MAKALIVVDQERPTRRLQSWGPPVPAMAPVANRPLLAHAIETVRRAGAREVVVVGDDAAAVAVRETVEEAAASGPVRWVTAHGELGPGEAILAAAEALEGERFMVHAGDGLLLRDRDALRRAAADTRLDAAVLLEAAPATVEGPRVRRLLTPWAARTTTIDEEPIELSGAHAFSPAIVDALRHVAPGPDGRRPLVDALDRLAAGGGMVQAGLTEGWWRYRGRAEDLLDANHLALDELDAGVAGHVDEESRVEGRVRVHETARVTRSLIRGPVLIGPGANVTDAYVGPYTTIGDRATIENAEIESSIVMAGATVRHIGVRIEGSIVGRRATVTRDFGLPRAVRLLIGDAAQVSLS